MKSGLPHYEGATFLVLMINGRQLSLSVRVNDNKGLYSPLGSQSSYSLASAKSFNGTT